MADKAPELKVGDDMRGVKKSSPVVPLVVLAACIVGFTAYAITVPHVEVLLTSVADVQEIPEKGRNLWVIARVGPERALHFRLFDRSGEQVANNLDEAQVAANALLPGLLDTLKHQLTEDEWDAPARKDFLDDNWAVFLLVTYPDDVFQHVLAAGIQDYATQVADEVSSDYPSILQKQLKTIAVVALYALITGLFGLVYRRAFWPWFMAAFVILFLVNRGFDITGVGAVAPVDDVDQSTLANFYVVEETILLLLVGFRLRRQSVSAIGPTERRRAVVLGAVLVLVATALAYGFYGSTAWRYVLEGAGLLVFLAFVLVMQTRIRPAPVHGKNIVVCLDGTWNQPGQKDFDHVAVTNVFKLFQMCKGSASRAHFHASQFKVHGDSKTGIKQIALYYQGVGNRLDNSEIGQALGGGFGLGAAGIVERAYLDVVKAYCPGDRIFVFGFSRGAAIARLVAGVIGRRGVPMSLWTLRLLGRHWVLWQSRKALAVKIDVLGCWDTVGAFGISKNILGIPFQRINLLKDLSVSLAVKRAYHMVALDETRDSFEPTLMEPDPTAPDRIVEVWFSGNHSNVGGGYATDNLSDVTLDFILRRISSGYAWDAGQVPGDESWGLHLRAALKGLVAKDAADPIWQVEPNPRGTIRHSTGPVYSYAPRKLPAHAVIYDSVFDRMYDSLPVYAPQSLFDLNQDLVKKRKSIEVEVGHLVETASIESAGSTRILEWSNQHLSLMKWSNYEALPLGNATPLKQQWQPAVELQNPPML